MLHKIFSIAFVCCFFSWVWAGIAPPSNDWLAWKDKIEKSYSSPFSAPSITHHIYLTKIGDKAYLKTSGKYPRFQTQACPTCLWVVERSGEKELQVTKNGKKSKNPFPLGETTRLEGALHLTPLWMEDDKKMRVFVHDMAASNLNKKRKRIFFPHNANFVYQGKFDWLTSPREMKIQRSDGSQKIYMAVAEVYWLVNGKEMRLSVLNYNPSNQDYKQESESMLLYRDLSNGSKTYGAGRFLNVFFPKKMADMKDKDNVVIDLNYSYNPPCAVSTGFHCPLPQEIVSLSVEAGEKYIKH